MSDQILQACEACGAAYNVATFKNGQKLQCAQCQNIIVVRKDSAVSPAVVQKAGTPRPKTAARPGTSAPKLPATKAGSSTPRPKTAGSGAPSRVSDNTTPSPRTQMSEPPVAGMSKTDAIEEAPREEDPLFGKMIGNCRVISKLGEGGMGAVYKGRHEALQNLVAIKVLFPELSAKRGVVDRFLREARTAARLQHPNIVQVINVGEEAGHNYIVMQFVDGP
jgi:hypothetical protein